MCQNFFDIRTFGAVMTTFVKGALNCGQVRGPVQLSFARSIDPILRRRSPSPAWPSPPRPTRRKKTPRWDTSTSSPYALYRAEGFVSANLARRVTGFSEEDLQLLWQAILNMFEHDPAQPAARWRCGN